MGSCGKAKRDRALDADGGLGELTGIDRFRTGNSRGREVGTKRQDVALNLESIARRDRHRLRASAGYRGEKHGQYDEAVHASDTNDCGTALQAKSRTAAQRQVSGIAFVELEGRFWSHADRQLCFDVPSFLVWP